MMIMTPTGTPKNILIIVAIPVIPPTTIPAGRRNIFIDAEKSTAPAMTAAASKRYFAYLFLVFSILSVLSYCQISMLLLYHIRNHLSSVFPKKDLNDKQNIYLRHTEQIGFSRKNDLDL